jgi:hypothetical protein
MAPSHVFDAFGWCPSDELEWRRPAMRWGDSPIDETNPARMAFVLRQHCEFLPSEMARVHVFGLGLDDEARALAPWAIDEATDQLFSHRRRPADLMWLAADSLSGLFWGLHDWAHFHNHGPFEERAWTELQCDATALAWLWVNRDAVPLTVERWHQAHAEAERLSRDRFAAEATDFDRIWFDAERVMGLACS